MDKVREVVPAASSSAPSPAQGPRSLLGRGAPRNCSFDSESPFTVGLSLFRSLLLCHPEQSPRNAAVGLSQGADSQGCCHAHRFVDLQTWGGQRCSQNLRPAGAGPGKGRGRARRGHPPSSKKKKKKNPRLTGVPISKLHAPDTGSAPATALTQREVPAGSPPAHPVSADAPERVPLVAPSV